MKHVYLLHAVKHGSAKIEAKRHVLVVFKHQRAGSVTLNVAMSAITFQNVMNVVKEYVTVVMSMAMDSFKVVRIARELFATNVQV